MKLMEFFSQAQSLGADQNDPLLSIVKNMHAEQARLKSLRSETQSYLIPQKTSLSLILIARQKLKPWRLISKNAKPISASIKNRSTKLTRSCPNTR